MQVASWTQQIETLQQGVKHAEEATAALREQLSQAQAGGIAPSSKETAAYQKGIIEWGQSTMPADHVAGSSNLAGLLTHLGSTLAQQQWLVGKMKAKLAISQQQMEASSQLSTQRQLERMRDGK
eukprot:gene6781-6998_t